MGRPTSNAGMAAEERLTSRGQLRRSIAAMLRDAGVVWADAESRWIVEAAAGRVHDVPPEARAQLEPRVVEAALNLTRRRARGEPLQYVTGVTGFRRLELEVGPGVFIPRPETELVAERAMTRLPPSGCLVDAATGSGAIALAIADERPDARVLATELSADALAWAERNARSLGLCVELLAGDLLAPLPPNLRGRVDVVVSNPPYVPAGDGAALPRDVVDHEPHLALFAGGGGLEIAERIADEARGWLAPGGALVLEIGETQGAEAAAMLSSLGYGRAAIHRDLTGRERIAEAVLGAAE